MKLTRVGVDLAKQVFQVHGVDRSERPAWCKRLKRSRWIAELERASEPGAEIVFFDDERFPGHDRRYADMADADLPRCESLKDTVARFLPFWESDIAPALRDGKRVLVAAHGNSLRALVKYLDGISDADIIGLNIPTGVPLVYDLDDELRPRSSGYLGDPERVAAAAAAVAAQGTARPA